MTKRGPLADMGIRPAVDGRGHTGSPRCPIDGQPLAFDTDEIGRSAWSCPQCARRKAAEARLAELQRRAPVDHRRCCKHCPNRVEGRARTCDDCKATARQRNRRNWYVRMTPERRAAFLRRCMENEKKRKLAAGGKSRYERRSPAEKAAFNAQTTANAKKRKIEAAT